MEFTKISGTDIESSRIGLGCWAIGGWLWGGSEERESIDTIISALDRGITLIDTAAIYGFGRSEEIVGKAIAEYGNRGKIILATKAGLDWTSGKVYRNSTRDRIMKEVEDSLTRLRTDYIDIYQIHWPDYDTPIEETAKAMNELFERGVIKAIGVSNYSPEQMDVFRKNSPLHTSQPPYNLFERGIEEDILPYCDGNKITMLLYGAICRGLLSGRMNKDTQFEGDDIRKADPKFGEPRFAQYLEAVSLLDEYARKHYGKRVIHLAVRWVLDKAPSHIALWGARRPSQLDPVGDITGWSLKNEDFEAIDRILEEAISEPVGPEFMAPPEHGPA
ncbi:MAG TPA: aldo/keto reductase [Thermodesulfobacteriota bacterium]|nr:aldo/keto reductase [Thermodesulfobacteriota bacterium]